MKKLLFAALFLSLFVACKKDDDDNQPAEPKAKIFAGFDYDNPDAYSDVISYDGSGRVVKVEDAEDRTTLEYSGNNVKVKVFRKSENREVYDGSGVLNAQGYLVSMAGTSAYSSPDALETFTLTLEYNANGQVTKRILNYDNGTRVYDYRYTYTNDNLTERKSYYNGVLSYSGKWEYGDAPNKLNVDWEYFDCANTFTPKMCKNMPVKYTAYKSDGTQNWWVEHTYTFDANGYPKVCDNTYSDGDKLKVSYRYY
jgi:hypothetical protein